MKVSIVNGGSDDNRGDSAITLGLLKVLDKVFDEPKYSVHSEYNYRTDYSEYRRSVRNIKKEYASIDLYTSIFSGYNKKSSIKSVLTALKATLLLINPDFFSRFYSLKSMDAISDIRNSDLIISKGGYHFYSDGKLSSEIKLFKKAFPLLLAKKMNKQYAMVGQSYGPFESKYSVNLIKTLINNSEITTARDHESLAFLLTLEGINHDKLSFEDDFAFLVTKPKNKPELLFENNPYLDTNKKFIGINIKELNFKKMTRDNYLNSFVKIIEVLLKKTKYEIIIIPHTTGPSDFEDDNIIARDLFNLVKKSGRVHIFKNIYTSPELLYVYNKLDVLIANRIHASISALSVGVPTIAIAYEGYKADIINDFGLNNAIFESSTLSEKEAVKIAELAISMTKDIKLKQNIKNKLKDVRAETFKSFKNLKSRETDNE